MIYVRQIGRLPTGRCQVMEYVIMRYVQSLPPLVEPPPGSDAPTAIAATAAAHRVGAQRDLRTIPHPQPTDIPVPPVQRRHAPRTNTVETERRTYSRRIKNEPVLKELRSVVDRRRHNQRKNDLTTAIDEKV